MATDFYQILGIDRDASQSDIKKAYRRLSKELHPDKHEGDKDMERRFKEVNEAYEVLSDESKRRQYDQFGRTGGPGGGQGGFDFSGFQNADFSGFGDVFENFFGGRQNRGRQQSNSGRDLEVALTITFAEMVSGIEKTILINRQRACDACSGSGVEEGSKLVTCSDCGGTGQVTKTAQSFFGTIQQNFLCQKCGGQGKTPEKPCSKCHGEGRMEAQEEVVLSVPAGIHDGQTLRLHGEGDAGKQGGAFGSLYVHIRVQSDTRFERDGDNVHSTTTIPVIDAILGSEVSIETVHGRAKLKIPSGTQPSQIFRLKNKGLPVLNTSRHGDHYVKIEVEVPSKLSRDEKKLMEEWKRLT